MRMHGRHGQVAIGSGSPLTVVAALNKWTLNMARDYVDVTAFGDTNKAYVPGLPDISGTLGGFLDQEAGSPDAGGSAALLEAAEGDVPVTLRLTPNTEQAARYWEGPAYLDVSIDVAVNGACAISGNFKASGAWQRV